MTLLEGRVVLVAGIGPGLGTEIALAAADHGARVVLGARTVSRCEELADEIGTDRAAAVALDVTDPGSCDGAVSTALERFGRLDGLVNNAFMEGDFRRLVDADLDRWRSIFEVNFFGAMTMVRSAVDALSESGDGRVLMVNTMSTQRIVPRYGAYAGSKGALATVTRTLALELGERGIRVNGIHPGYIYGPNVQAYFEHQAQRRGVGPREIYDEVAAETALGYLPTAAEIAGTAVFLLSPLARPVTGQAIGVTAGHTV